MIKPNELRIGNLLLHKMENKPYRVETLSVNPKDRNLVVCLFGYIPYCSLEFMAPIPLKPEILERCGFVLIKEPRYGDYFYKNGIQVKSNFIGSIKFVHQLQNYYFCNSGWIELDISSLSLLPCLTS